MLVYPPGPTLPSRHLIGWWMMSVCWVSLIGCGTSTQNTPPEPPPPSLSATNGSSRVDNTLLDAPGYFGDVTAKSGITAQYRNGEEADHYSILESLGGGVGLIDYDRDGWLDVFITGGGFFEGKQVKGHPNRLFRNQGNWTFRDVTSELGLDQPLCYSHGCSVGDYDGDGWPDLLVTGYGRLALYRNLEGKRFQETTGQAGLLVEKSDLHWSTASAWAELDDDQHLDLIVTHYLDWSFDNHPRCRGFGPDVPVDVCPPNRFAPLMPQLFINNGNGSFREVGKQAGLQPGKGLGVLVLDINDDGRLDIYVANDTMANHLYINSGDGHFTESGLINGVAMSETGEPQASMGVDAADIDGSGRFSLFVTNYQQQMHDLYRNRGDVGFDHASSPTGIAALGTNHVGWGTAFFDYDWDGDEDLAIVNGHAIRHPPPPQRLAQFPELLENEGIAEGSTGTARFRNVAGRAGSYFRRPHRARGLTVGDLDNNGRLDLIVSHVNEPVVVLRNEVSDDNHWLGVDLLCKDHRDITGTRITLEANGRTQQRMIKSGTGYLGSNDRRVVFGLGTTQDVDRLTIQWRDGLRQTLGGDSLSCDRYHQFVHLPEN